MESAKPDQLFTAAELARRLGLPVERIYRAIREGELPARRVGNWPCVRLSDANAWLVAYRIVQPSGVERQLRDALERCRDIADNAVCWYGDDEQSLRDVIAVVEEVLDKES